MLLYRFYSYFVLPSMQYIVIYKESLVLDFYDPTLHLLKATYFLYESVAILQLDHTCDHPQQKQDLQIYLVLLDIVSHWVFLVALLVNYSDIIICIIVCTLKIYSISISSSNRKHQSIKNFYFLTRDEKNHEKNEKKNYQKIENIENEIKNRDSCGNGLFAQMVNHTGPLKSSHLKDIAKQNYFSMNKFKKK